MVERHRGNLIKNTGDGILATFNGPGRAVRGAPAFSTAARRIGLPLRSGLHTGEIEVRGHDIGGIAVHAAARSWQIPIVRGDVPFPKGPTATFGDCRASPLRLRLKRAH